MIYRLDVMILGEKIRFYRECLSWSQVELARRCELTSAAISKIESGKSPSPGASTILKICNALNVSYRDIMDDKECEVDSEFFSSSEFLDFLKLNKKDRGFVLSLIKRFLKD